MRNKLMVRIGVVCAMLALLCASEVVASASLGSPKGRGGEAPDFTLETTAGTTVSLKELKGKGVVLFFFTTWCPYCRRKFPELARDYEQHQKDNVEILVIDAGESQKKVSSFVSRQNPALPFPILLDKDMTTTENYGVNGVPTYVLISPEGQIVYQDNELPKDFKKLLE